MKTLQYLRSIFLYLLLVLMFLFCACIYLPPLLIFGSRSINFLRVWFGRMMILAGFHKLQVYDLPYKSNGPYIFAFNHQSFWDIFIIPTAIDYHFSAIGKKELLKIPVLGLIIKRYGIVLIDRKNHDQAMSGLRDMIDQIKSGLNIVIFPEGTRSKDGKVAEFKNGAFIAAFESGVPIVPSAIVGAYQAAPYGSWVIYPRIRFEVRFAQPIVYEQYKDMSLDELKCLVRDKIIDLTA